MAIYVAKANYISTTIGYIIYIQFFHFDVNYQQIVLTISLLLALFFLLYQQ